MIFIQNHNCYISTFLGFVESNLLEKWVSFLESSLTEEEEGFAEDKQCPCVICSLHESIIGALLKRIVSRSVVLKTCVQSGKL